MDDLEIKIYFIYSQKGKMSNIAELETNEKIKKIEKLAVGTSSDNLYILYCVTVLKDKNDKFITLMLIDKQGILYTKNINLKDIDIFQYQVIFKPYYNKDDNNLNQIILPFEEQFTIFKEILRKDSDLLYYLYSSRINSIFFDKSKKLEFSFLLNFFLELYEQYNYSSEMQYAIIKYFINIDLKRIDNNIDNQSQNKSISKYFLNDSSDANKINQIRNDLIEMADHKE
jgi:hypothetical protein